MSWEALAAGAALGALVLAFVQAIASGIRSTILYTTTRMKGHSDKIDRLYALKIEFRNISFRHITDVTLRVDMQTEPLAFGVSETSSIDSKTISTAFENDQLIINIPDLPRFEKVSLDIFSSEYLSEYRSIHGIGKTFALKNKTKWFWFRVNSILILLAIVLNAIGAIDV
jgi:hypothetical protein